MKYRYALNAVRMGLTALALWPAGLLAAVQCHAAGEVRLSAITRSPGHFVAVGSNGVILRSEDGRSWTKQPASTDAYLRGITFGDGCFVAVGDGGAVVTGTDSAGWQSLQPLGSNTLRQVTFGRGQFIAVGDGGVIQSSMDGLHWRPLRSPTTASLRCVAFGSGRFVAVGEGGVVVTSCGGNKAWKPVDSGTESCLRGIAYGNGVFVAIAPNRSVLTSWDGLRWSRRADASDEYHYGISFTGREFIAVGCGGRAAVSSDGQSWRPLDVKGRGDLLGVAGTPDRMIAVGETGAILLHPAESVPAELSFKTQKSGIDGNGKLLDK
jgi:photosystem II stability/assembly factor-like uncharacterized protein